MYKIKDGVVISLRELNTSDLLVKVFSKGLGVQNLVAKGAQKSDSKLRPSLSELNKLDFFIIPATHSKFDIIIDTKFKSERLNLRKGQNNLLCAKTATSLVDRFIWAPHKNKRLYDMVEKKLSVLDQEEINKKDRYLFSAAFKVKFLVFLGSKPRFNNCGVCGDKVNLEEDKSFGFSFEKSAIICSDCMNNFDYSTYTSNFFKNLIFLLGAKFDNIGKEDISIVSAKGLDEFLNKFLNYQIA